MLVYVEVLIGVTVVMLGFSLVITVINQVAASIFALRGRNLKWGLSVLIQELHGDNFASPSGSVPLFGRDVNPSVGLMVDKVLSHRLISDSKFPLHWWKLATAIRFDEFLKVVDLLGDPKNPSTETDDLAAIKGLQWLRQNNRITEAWFNSVMDRVSQRFTMHMRIYTIIVALMVVAVTRIDSLYLVTVLRNDAHIRSGLVSAAESIRKSDAVDASEQDKLKKVTQSVVDQLPADQSLLSLIRPDKFDKSEIPGLLLSVLLLSLGSPFWFNTLKNLVDLRTVIAKKEESERTEAAAARPGAGGRITWKEAAHA